MRGSFAPELAAEIAAGSVITYEKGAINDQRRRADVLPYGTEQSQWRLSAAIFSSGEAIDLNACLDWEAAVPTKGLH